MLKYLKPKFWDEHRVGWIIALWRSIPHKPRWAITEWWLKLILTGEEHRRREKNQAELRACLVELEHAMASVDRMLGLPVGKEVKHD